MNPTVLFEVTSNSSEECDTSVKLECYQTIPTLSDYVVASHRERRITIHAAAVDVGVQSLRVDLVVDEICRGSSIAT